MVRLTDVTAASYLPGAFDENEIGVSFIPYGAEDLGLSERFGGE